MGKSRQEFYTSPDTIFTVIDREKCACLLAILSSITSLSRRTRRLGNGAAHSGLDPPTPINLLKMIPQICPEADLM